MKQTERGSLAIEGGPAVRVAPFPPWPVFAQDEIDAVAAVLASGRVNYWTGDECKAFEREFAAVFGRRYGIALANGTVALELALHALGVGPGDEVIVPSRTFIATASCVIALGAMPVVADVDANSGNLTAQTISAALTARTRAVIPVHMAGWPCDMEPIMALAAKHGLHVIEDCAQSHGATYKGQPAGSFGSCAAFSFCQDKIMTTGGEGGMLLTDDEAVWRRAWEYKDHGKSWDAVHKREHPLGFRWLHESFGSNFRMTEMQAAIGRRQLAKLPDWLSRRRANADFLAARLGKIRGLRVPLPDGDVVHAWYKFYAFIEPDLLKPGWDQIRIIEAIDAEGIPCGSGSCSEIYREKAFSGAGLAPPLPLPVAARLGRTSLVFLVHPTLSTADMDATAAVVAKVMGEACA
jgi:dTDP-4-amino-4,6-dideoxygalactose transaminase